uniref:Uncharacterized protein n=1 Tax=Steinernema glaseri TaxID=37863 RepID=A0A1I7YQH2_9BILA
MDAHGRNRTCVATATTWSTNHYTTWANEITNEEHASDVFHDENEVKNVPLRSTLPLRKLLRAHKCSPQRMGSRSMLQHSKFAPFWESSGSDA